MITVKTDNYSEVINHKNTYETIARDLFENHSVIIGWTDQKMTHYDILFTLGAVRFGSLQRGLKSTDLYISVIGRGAFGFSLDNDDRQGSYISDKLGIKGSEDEINELVNGVVKAISEE